MADIVVTATSVKASSNANLRRDFNFGAAVTAGQLVYLDVNNLWQLADSNAAVTGNVLTDLRGIALDGGANGQPAVVCINDSDFTPGATLTNGVSYYGSPNAGAIAPAADIISGNYPVFLGIAKSTTKLNLAPVPGGTVI